MPAQHLLLPGQLERLGQKQLLRPPAIACGQARVDDSKFFDFPFHQGKMLLPQLQKAASHQAWLSASITAMRPGQQRLSCLEMRASSLHPGLVLVAGPITTAPQRRSWLSSTAQPSQEMMDMQVGTCTAQCRMCWLSATRFAVTSAQSSR